LLPVGDCVSPRQPKWLQKEFAAVADEKGWLKGGKETLAATRG